MQVRFSIQEAYHPRSSSCCKLPVEKDRQTIALREKTRDSGQTRAFRPHQTCCLLPQHKPPDGKALPRHRAKTSAPKKAMVGVATVGFVPALLRGTPKR